MNAWAVQYCCGYLSQKALLMPDIICFKKSLLGEEVSRLLEN